MTLETSLTIQNQVIFCDATRRIVWNNHDVFLANNASAQFRHILACDGTKVRELASSSMHR